MSFSFKKKNCDIYIYGAGTLGRRYADELLDSEYNVVGFIDKNAGCFKEKADIPVYPIEKKIDSNSVIVICMHNALWHPEAALELYKGGLRNILFIPFSDKFTCKKASLMFDAYNWFQAGEYGKLENIPSMDELMTPSISADSPIALEYGSEVILWMDITYLYSSIRNSIHKGEILIYANTPMPGLRPYVDLFRYLGNPKQGSPQLFLKMMKENQDSFLSDDEEYLTDRKELYLLLKERQNLSNEYFLKAAPECVWNERGYYSLMDGQSRTTFLFIQGYRFVPVRMPADQYQGSLCKGELLEFLEHLRMNHIDELDYDTEHPAFIDFPVRYKNVAFQALCCIQEMLAEKKWSGLVIDKSHYHGRIGRYFYRQGADVLYCSSKKHYQYDVLLNLVFGGKIKISCELSNDDIRCARAVCASVKNDQPEIMDALLQSSVAADKLLVLIFENCSSKFIENIQKCYGISPVQSKWRCVGKNELVVRMYQGEGKYE